MTAVLRYARAAIFGRGPGFWIGVMLVYLFDGTTVLIIAAIWLPLCAVGAWIEDQVSAPMAHDPHDDGRGG